MDDEDRDLLGYNCIRLITVTKLSFEAWEEKDFDIYPKYIGEKALKIPRNLSSLVIIPNVSDVSRTIMPCTPVNDAILHSATVTSKIGSHD